MAICPVFRNQHRDLDFHESKHKNALKWFRILIIVPNLVLSLFVLLFEGKYSFLYLTNWGLYLTFWYYFAAALSYQSRRLKQVCYVFFEVLWPINVVITLAFWLYIFPAIYPDDYLAIDLPTHTFPVTCTMTEFFISKIVFIRAHYIYPLSTLSIYLLLILLPYSLSQGPIYPGITFKNYITFIVIFGILVLLFISLESGRFLKIKSCKEPRENDMIEISNQ